MTGCSYIFVTTPQEQAGYTTAGDCTTNIAAPVIDTLLTTTNLFSTLYVAGENNVANKGQAVGIGVLATGFWLSSAIYGYYNTSKCAELRAESDPGPYRRPIRVRRRVPPGPYRSAPPPYPASGEDSVDGMPPAPPPYPSNAPGVSPQTAPIAPPQTAPIAPPQSAPIAPPQSRAPQQKDDAEP